MIGLLLLGLAAVPSFAAEKLDARDVYAVFQRYGRPIRATTFSEPSLIAYTREGAECYIGVLDRDQKFAKDSAGHLTGKDLMCQVLQRRNGRQVSFTDYGCDGANLLAERVPENEFQATLQDCSRKLLGLLMSGVWQEYTTAAAMEKKGWPGKKVRSVDMSVDRSGRAAFHDRRPPESAGAASAQLDDLGRTYDRFFGRPALTKLAGQDLWAYSLGEKITALQVFQKASWWSAAASAAPAPAPAPPSAPAPKADQPSDKDPDGLGAVPLLR